MSDIKKLIKDFNLKYKIGSKIGIGGYSIVYSGKRLSDNLPIAVKIILCENVPEWFYQETGLKIPLEICVMQKLKKVNGCVQLLDWFESSEYFILITERPLLCKDLFDIITENKYLTEKQSSVYFKQVIETLIQLKNLSIYHGDIKEENIIIDLTTNKAKLIDFGASWLDQKVRTKLYGTTVYAPPEWFLSNSYNGDEGSVWSLGILLYSMVCGVLPFNNENRVKHGKFVFTRNCTDTCKDLISLCLSIEPNKRPLMEHILSHPWFR